jgi:hypothetical protein
MLGHLKGMPGFAPQCPRCGSADVKQVGMHDRYANGSSHATAAPTSTVFAYKCKCGLAFTFEIKHGGEQPAGNEKSRRPSK